MGTQHNMLPFVHVGLPFVHRGIEKIKYSVILAHTMVNKLGGMKQ